MRPFLSGFVLSLAVASAAAQSVPGLNTGCSAASDLGFQGFAGDSANPRSDSDLAVGRCKLIATTNFGIRSFSKSGSAGALDKATIRSW